MDHLREGDVLAVWKLDRLGRNTQHVLAVVDELTSRGIGFRSLTEGLHTDGPMGKAMLTIMAHGSVSRATCPQFAHSCRHLK
jgi:DNA invertase Pin-like site-specific DNA recombinase